MDRRTLLAITLCFFIFYAWQKFYIEPRVAPTLAPQGQDTPGAVPQVSTNPAPQGSASSLGSPKTPSSSTPQKTSSEERHLPTGTGEAILSNGNKLITGWSLKSYRLGLAPEAASVDLSSVTHQNGEVELAFDDPAFSYLASIRGRFTPSNNGGLIWSYEDDNVRLVREISAPPEKPYFDIITRADFKAKRPSFAFLSLASQKISDDPEERDRQLLYFTNKSIERVTLSDTPKLQEIPTSVKYIAAQNRYFLLALVALGQDPKGLIQPLTPDLTRASLVYPVSSQSISLPVRVYFGPKELDILRATEPALDHAVDFGMFTAIAYPILKLLKWIYQFSGNYGVAIILLTLLLKVMTYPLTYKSMKSMKEMAKIQPQIQKIREKHKDDREALNREMLSLMRGHGYNPMAGCLPILIQMPVFFALYQVLYSSIELYHAPFGFWIHDLSSRDPFYVTPILLSITMYIQQKLTPNTATDPMQQKMLQFMPLMFGAFMLALPSGLTIYMLVNALASILQQIILNKRLDPVHVSAVAARAR